MLVEVILLRTTRPAAFHARPALLQSVTLAEVVPLGWLIALAPYNVPAEVMSQGHESKFHAQ